MSFRMLLRFVLHRYGRWLVGLGLGALLLFWVVRSCRQAKPQRGPGIKAYGITHPAGYTYYGIDVSKHNAAIDWPRVAQAKDGGIAVRFVFIKATEGATLSDRNFDRNWQAAESLGFRRGAYHFFHPTRDPIKQANNFIRHVALSSGDFAPVLDFEVVNGQSAETIISGLRQWLTVIEEHYGIRPIIYTNRVLYRRYIQHQFEEYPLWLADYSVPDVEQYATEQLYIWQYSHSARLKGIRSQVDFNVFIKDSDELSAICLP